MNSRCMLLTAMLVCVLPATVHAVDLTMIARSIKKEPEYQTKSPGYCLLVFGKEARTRVWMVVDGPQLYLDRNGNGDLTEADELIRSSTSASYRRFKAGQVREVDGTTLHDNLQLRVYKDDKFRCSIKLARGCHQYVGSGSSSYTKPYLGASPQDAPIIHLNGPMTFTQYGPVSFLPRDLTGHSDRKTALRIMIGSPGLGGGTFASYSCQALRCDTGYRSVTADVEFSTTAGADPITLRDHLKVLN